MTSEVSRRRDEDPDEAEATPQPTRAAGGEVRSVVARELLGTRGLLHIEHEGETYTLRLTRNNRLILTK